MASIQTTTLTREARLTLEQEATLLIEPIPRFDQLTLDAEATLTLDREAEAVYSAAAHSVYFVQNVEDHDSFLFIRVAEDYS